MRPRWSVLTGDVRETLRTVPDATAQTCVTSPPYYGLRDYGAAGQIGQEQSPAEYVSTMVAVMREVRRVLRDDGTLWLNVGDSFAADRGGTTPPAETLAGGTGGRMADGSRTNRGRRDGYNPSRDARAIGFKHKDLMGIPWRLAFALQDDGWYLRSDIVWAKPNPMPESVTDRPTRAHEYVFLLTKRARYFYDGDAIREEFADARKGRSGGAKGRERNVGGRADGYTTPSNIDPSRNGGRNARDVWTIATKPYSGAHFATMPLELATRCILAGSRKGDLVLDPFGGAGTTALAALQHGREALLCELNPDYASLQRERLACFDSDTASPVQAGPDADFGPLFGGRA